MWPIHSYLFRIQTPHDSQRLGCSRIVCTQVVDDAQGPLKHVPRLVELPLSCAAKVCAVFTKHMIRKRGSVSIFHFWMMKNHRWQAKKGVTNGIPALNLRSHHLQHRLSLFVEPHS